ncbi:MAG: hypothetical protein ACI9BW_002358 [Gammaproteobacteria bacterium]|jgi:hypothetical protein
MSEFELLNTFVLHMDLVQTYFVAFISATSAFLVVAHLAAKELSSTIVKLAIGLYTFTAIFFLASFQRTFAGTIGLRDKLLAANMTWYPAVSEPQWLMPTVMWIGVVVMVVLTTGSISYFVASQRRAHAAR